MNEKVIGFIPARYQSHRFPGKPLVLILGKSLIQRTYEQAKKAKSLNDVIVATDDLRIFEHVESFGGKVIMTSSDHLTGTDRLAEAAKHYLDATYIVNIQGDEPCIDPHSIDLVVQALIKDTQAVMSTAVSLLTHPEEAASTSVVKCTVDLQGRALYFSRNLIPANKLGTFNPKVRYLRHMGLYAYKRDFLLSLSTLPTSPLSLEEDLEQLKVLENGYKIHVIQVEEASHGVDLPEDIEKIEKILCRQNMSL